MAVSGNVHADAPAALPAEVIAALLEPYLRGAAVPATLYEDLSAYLALLLRWNARTNLTAIREPAEIVQRHFGESLFAALELSKRLPPGGTVLDFGSGAGFPGLPLQLLLPDARVTLAESQGKKAAFLREAVRALGLRTEVWAARVEDMPAVRHFDAVTLRAVDKMDRAMAAARVRVAPGGWLVALSTTAAPGADTVAMPGASPGWVSFERAG